ncbi:hypothetical protein D3C85_1052650 [compost metagenome]
MPAGGQRACFRLTVTDDAGDDQLRIIKRGTVGMGQAVAKFATFMDRSGNLSRYMAGNAIRPRKLPKQANQAVAVALHRRTELGVRAFEVGLGDHRRAAMTGTGDENHVQIVLFDQAIEVGIDQVQPGCRAPMAKQARLDVLQGQRQLQQRVVLEVNLPHGQIIGGPPIGIQTLQLLSIQKVAHVLLRRGPTTDRRLCAQLLRIATSGPA